MVRLRALRRENEREGERVREREREKERERAFREFGFFVGPVCVCFVWRERDGERK